MKNDIYNSKVKVIRDIFDTIMSEGYFETKEDAISIYNKDKFESGEINLCFITGHSGSGKSTKPSSFSFLSLLMVSSISLAFFWSSSAS